MSADLSRRLLAEWIGTGILVMFGTGSVVAALTVGGGELDYAGLGMVAIGGAAAAFAFDAVARPRAYELELAQGTQGAIEGRRDAPVEPPAFTTPDPGGRRPAQSP